MKVVNDSPRLLLKKNYWNHKCHIQRIYDGFHPLHDTQFMFILYITRHKNALVILTNNLWTDSSALNFNILSIIKKYF